MSWLLREIVKRALVLSGSLETFLSTWSSRGVHVVKLAGTDFAAALGNPRRALWTGQWVRTRWLFEGDYGYSIIQGEASAISRDANGDLVLTLDASVPTVELEFTCFGAVRFPRHVGAEVRLGGAPATGQAMVGVRIQEDGTADYVSGRLEKSAGGWDRRALDSGGAASSVVALGTDPTTTDHVLIVELLSRFPTGAVVVYQNAFAGDAFGNNTSLGVTSTASLFPLTTANGNKGRVRFYATRGASGDLTVTIRRLQATLCPGLEDPFV